MSLKLRLVCVGVLLTGTVGGQMALARHLAAVDQVPPGELAQPLPELPLTLGPWQGEDQEIDESTQYADAHLERVYVHAETQQSVSVWMAYSQTGEDRQHHPEICMAVSGQPEDQSVRQTLEVPGHPQPVQQYRFGRTGKFQRVFYWYYLLPGAQNTQELTSVQKLYQKLRRKSASITLEVFAPERTPQDVEAAEEFVRLLDAAFQTHLPAGAERGNLRLPVKYIGAE